MDIINKCHMITQYVDKNNKNININVNKINKEL